MNSKVFPFIALGLGLLLAMTLIVGGALGGQLMLPLLAALLMSEFGFILNLAGLYFAYKNYVEEKAPVMLLTLLGSILLAVFFLWLGIELWPDNLSG